MTLFFALTVLLAGVFVIAAETGVDLSVATSPDTWSCLVGKFDVSFAIIRTYRNKGVVDENSPNTLLNAHNAGVKDLGAYIFPCVPSSTYATTSNVTCESPAIQVMRTVEYLIDNQIGVDRTNPEKDSHRERMLRGTRPTAFSVNRIWLDIEDEVPAKYYDADPAVNQAFIGEMVAALEKLQIPVGIYSTKTYWQNIMGNINGYGKYPLWYPRYDGINDLDFFAPFADFQTVQIKQTGGDSGWCGISQVDPDYRP